MIRVQYLQYLLERLHLQRRRDIGLVFVQCQLILIYEK
jgi:hypothetical protein